MICPTNNEMREQMKDVGECIGRAAKALGEFCREFAASVSALVPTFKWLSECANTKIALDEATPRVRHLANYGKKYRTQKKNINRALKDRRRRRKA